MKKLIFIALISFSFSSYSQNRDSIMIRSLQEELAETKEYLNFTNKCLYNVRKEKKIAFLMIASASSIIGLSNVNELNGTNRAKERFNKNYSSAGSNLEERMIANREYQSDLDKIETTKTVILATGGAIIIGGIVLNLISERWFTRAYIVPQKDGFTVGVKYNFKSK